MARRRRKYQDTAITRMLREANPPTQRQYKAPRQDGFEVRFEEPCGMCHVTMRIGERAVMRHGVAIHVTCAPGQDDA